MVTQERLKELLHYDPETGIFTRLTTCGGVFRGSLAGYVHGPTGYIMIKVDGKGYRAHRLAWMYMYGVMPKEFIDHVDRCRSNNRIANLRDVTRKQNNENTGLRKDNKSGFVGVSWFAQVNGFMAGIRHNGKRIHLGCFSDAKEASEAVEAMRDKLFTHHHKQAA